MASWGRVLASITAIATIWSLAGVIVYWVVLAPTLPSLGELLAQVFSFPSVAQLLTFTGAAVAWWIALVRLLFFLATILLLVLGIIVSIRYVHAEFGISPVGAESREKEQHVLKFGLSDRVPHFLVMIGGIIAGVTGFTLYYADNSFVYTYFYSPISREVLANLHVIGGLVGGFGVVLYIFYYLTDFALHVPSLGFKGALTKYYIVKLTPSLPRGLAQYFAWIFGLRREHPKYHKYMPSQILAYYSIAVLIMVVGVTGLGMTLWGIQFLNGVAWWAHVYGAAALTVLIAFHVVMGNLRPSHFPIDKTIFTGRVPLSKVREEWPLWYEEIVGGRA